MKLRVLPIGLVSIAIFALCQAVPTGRRRFRSRFRGSGRSGTNVRGVGSETAVNTDSKVEAGDNVFATSEGDGISSGAGRSSLDIESWAGFEAPEGTEENTGGGAGSVGQADGEDTKVASNSKVHIGDDAEFAISESRIGARGNRGRQSIFDFESFAELDGFSSGVAGGRARGAGAQSEVIGEASVKTERGKGTLSTSGSEGAAINNDGVAVIDLENFAGVEETNTEGISSFKGIGKNVNGSSGSRSFHGPNGEKQIAAESEGTAITNDGRAGIRSKAEAIDDLFSVAVLSEGRGEGENVYTSGNSKAGISGEKSAGKSQSEARASGAGRSFVESSASLVIGEKKPENQDAEIPPEDQEAQVPPEIHDEEIPPEIHDEEIPPEIQDDPIPPEIQDAEIVPDIQDVEIVPENQDVDTVVVCQTDC